MFESLLFILTTVLAINFSCYLSFCMTRNRDENLRLVLSIILFYMLVSSSILIGGFLSQLSSLSIFIIFALLNLSFLKKMFSINYFRGNVTDTDFSGLRGFGLFVVIFYFIISSLGSVWISLDDSTYHAAIPALWIKNGSFFVEGFTYQNNFPLNGSLFSSFFMLFFKTEEFSNVSELLLVLISFLTCDYLVRKNKSYNLAYIGLFIFFMSLDVQRYLFGFSDSDIMPSVFYLVLFSFLSEKKIEKSRLFLSSFILGFLVGVKLTNIFFSIPFIYLLLKHVYKRDLKLIAGVIILFLIPATPWYLKNFYEFGNPIYPFIKMNLNGLFSNELVKISSLKGSWQNFDYNQKMLVLKGFLGWGHLSWIPTLLSFSLPICIYRRTTSNNTRTFFALSIISVIAFVIVYIDAPFSGLNESLEPNINSSRYLLPIVLSLLVISLGSLKINVQLKHQGILFIAFLLPYIFVPRGFDKKTLVALAIVTLLLIINKIKVRRLLFCWPLLLFLLCLSITFVYSGSNMKKHKENSIWYLSFLNDLSQPKTITMFDGFIFRSYFLLGQNFIHNPIRLNYYGQKQIKFNKKEELRNYIYVDLKPPIIEGYCHLLSNNLYDSNVEILILGTSPSGEVVDQECPQIKLFYYLVQTHAKGKIYKLK